MRYIGQLIVTGMLLGLVLGVLLAAYEWADSADRSQPCSTYGDRPLRDVPARCVSKFQPQEEGAR